MSSPRTCNCTGYLTNPGGRCCMDMQTSAPVNPVAHAPVPQINYFPAWWPAPLTEERVRELIREELDRKEK